MASVWTAAEPAKIGDAVKRKEDVRLLTGCGQFSDDMNAQGQLHAVIVRSPHPHAVIRGIDAALALGMPGVISILTGQDAQADHRVE